MDKCRRTQISFFLCPSDSNARTPYKSGYNSALVSRAVVTAPITGWPTADFPQRPPIFTRRLWDLEFLLARRILWTERPIRLCWANCAPEYWKLTIGAFGVWRGLVRARFAATEALSATAGGRTVRKCRLAIRWVAVKWGLTGRN